MTLCIIEMLPVLEFAINNAVQAVQPDTYQAAHTVYTGQIKP